MAEPRIVSEWVPVDRTANHLELALTDQIINSGKPGDGQQQAMAVRTTFNPNSMLIVTPGDLRALGQQVTDRNSAPGRILATASSGSQK